MKQALAKKAPALPAPLAPEPSPDAIVDERPKSGAPSVRPVRPKSSLRELAIFGAPPAFDQPLHVGRPNLGDRAQLFARMNEMLDRNWLSNNGPFVQEFERRLCAITGTKHCIPMANATIALEIAIRGLDLEGEVIVPSFTFVATAHALQWQEITPVFCDLDPRTANIDPARVEELITPRTTGIMGVHVWGRPCDVGSLQRVADRHGLKLLFDAAHAFGCSHHGTMVGNFGNAEVFSFHATKFLNSFEGGAIATNDDALAKRIRFMKNFGFEHYDRVSYLGTNGKMTEACAAMGLTSLDAMDRFLETNQRNWRAYARALADVPGIELMSFDPGEKHNWQYVVALVSPAITRVSRDDLVQTLHAENVLARRYFYPGCHRMEPYRSYYPHARLLLPETEKFGEKVLLLPTGTAVDEAQIREIAAIIRTATHAGHEVAAKCRALREHPAS
jgi:dTDP-4-amino-4,6-dideoxygalactose transaminase